MKYEIICPHCKNTQIYIPKKNRIPTNPHTNCSNVLCKKQFYFIEQIINDNTIDDSIVKNTIKKTNKKQKRNPGIKVLEDKIIQLDAETIERLIVEELNREKGIQVLRLAVDFYTKVKVDQGEQMERLDMNKFLEIGNNVAQDYNEDYISKEISPMGDPNDIYLDSLQKHNT